MHDGFAGWLHILFSPWLWFFGHEYWEGCDTTLTNAIGVFTKRILSHQARKFKKSPDKKNPREIKEINFTKKIFFFFNIFHEN